ncbi:MAG: IgGFc-binding protein, partial [Flavobacteriaceae bacterium]|nr:IgGFc-binding protein [Flavobacteriaceae bacterium]
MKFLKTIAIVSLFFNVIPVFSQLDYIHYFPPLKQATNNQALQNQRFYFSTPELVPFDISVYRGTNTSPIAVISGLSKSTPKTYNPGDGDNNKTLVTNTNTGVVLSNSGLRFESANGQKFYVNFRGRSGSQAGSLTCKGQAALGTDFRWGGIPNRAVTDGRLNSCMGIIASQDNTTVTISGYDSNCEFRLTNDPDGITANSISITLQAGQSYVLE